MTTIEDMDPKELAERIMHGFERDYGRSMAWFWGVDPSVIAKMTDEQLIAYGKAMAFPKQTHCQECGQTLPQDA